MHTHGFFAVRLEVVTEHALPIFDPQRMHKAGDPVEMLQHGVKPVLASLKQGVGT